jgi:hypothetical protein
MAHAIIFVDRPPRTRDHDFTSQYYTHSAGAYKIASVLRSMGLDVLVVPNCSNLTLQGIKKIIDQNSRNLLWVGISMTFFVAEVSPSAIEKYKKTWTESDEIYIDADMLVEKWNKNVLEDLKLVWGAPELGRISQYIEKKYNAALLVGGGYAEWLIKDPRKHRNMHVVSGYAETYVKEFTLARLSDSSAKPPILFSNTEYDNHDYKQSSILWTPSDMIEEDNWLPIEIARGCAFDCAFCSYHRRGLFDSYKDPKILYEELVRNYELFGVTRYLLVDDLYNDSKEKVRILYDKVWSRLPFKPEWASYMRLDMIWSDPESADLIRDSGCRLAAFGIETLHDVAGKKVGKGLGKKRILETLEILKKSWKNETLANALLIAGLPFEPYESIVETFNWSLTTDLIHQPSWNPMYINPPKDVPANKIEAYNEKYGIKWINSTEWVNSEGVTKTMVNDLVTGYATQLGQLGVRISLSSYIDLRIAGYTHQELANSRNLTVTPEDLQNRSSLIKNRIMARLDKIMQLTDS